MIKKKAIIIYNPVSGKKNFKKELYKVYEIIKKCGYIVYIFASTSKNNSIKNEAIRVSKLKFSLIVIAGGDGTINEVINGIALFNKKPNIAIIPSGTTNDYARFLKIPRFNILKAANIIRKNKILKMDVGKVGNKFFINMAAGGNLTELTYNVSFKLKNIFGYLAYFIQGIKYLSKIKMLNVRFIYENGIYEGKISMFFLCLTNSIGGFENIIPNQEFNDGKFSLIIIKTSNILEIIYLLILMINNNNEYINDNRLIYLKTSYLIIENLDNNKIIINLDGECGGVLPMKFLNYNKNINIFVESEKDIIFKNKKKINFFNKIKEILKF